MKLLIHIPIWFITSALTAIAFLIAALPGAIGFGLLSIASWSAKHIWGEPQ